MKLDQVKIALIAIRENFVEHCVKHDLRFPIDDLEGACGICSLLVFRMLKKMRYRPVFHMNNDHCFVTVNGYWIDLTLKQFIPHIDPVFFENHPYRTKSDRYFAHRSKKKATTERCIRRLFAKWPKDQNPFKQNIPNLPKSIHLTIYKSVV